MKTSRTISLPLLLLTVLLLTLPAVPGAAQDRVTLQLRWDHQFQFASYYAALTQGYYDEAGLEVDIVSAINQDGSIRSAVDEVAAGRADFGIGSTDILFALDRGLPLTIVASIFQKSGVAFFAPKSAGMHGPEDLIELRVSRRIGDMVDVELQAMLLAEGIDPALITPHPFDQTRGYLEEMIEGNIDVVPGYIIGTPHEAMELGLDIDTLRPADYGVDFYGDSLFTNRRMIEEHPALVTAFRDASLRGWEYALEHPHEIADWIIATYTPRFPIQDFPSFVRFQIEPVTELTLYPVVAIGNINPARWRRSDTTLIRLSLIRSAFDPAAAIFDPEREQAQRAARIRWWTRTVLMIVALLLASTIVWLLLLKRALARRTAELQRNEARYQSLVERIPVIIYTYRCSHGGVFYSPQVSSSLGYSPAQLLNEPLRWYESIHPDDKPAVDSAIEVSLSGSPARVEYRIRHRDGRWIWFLDTTYPRTGESETQIFDGVAHDITQLKQSEAELRATVQEKERLMRELNHRVKNNLLMVNSLIQLKDADLGPEVDLSDLLHRIDAIRIVHEKLNESSSVTSIRVSEYLSELIDTVFELSDRQVQRDIQMRELSLPTRDAVPLGLIVNELATNTVKHALGDSVTRFEVRLELGEGEGILNVGNSGPPISAEIDLEQPRTLGLRLITSLTRQIGGRLDVTPSPHPRFRIAFPIRRD